MKKLCWYGGLWLAVGLCLHSLYAASIIKTNTGDLSYFNRLQIFGTGEQTVQGWVRLNNGFAVASRASAFMDTFITVSGQMDLGETGTLVLNGNLFLDNSVTLTSGGNIKGKRTSSEPAGTIFMGGDLTLGSASYARVLHITGDWSNSGTTGDLIIDGMGHTLDIQDRAQIFVDSNVTLTLRNMTIKTGPKSLNNPAIQLASLGSKLTLDNVMFDLGADFHFITGQLFIHNEVAVTGTSAFVYQSPKPSYITSGAMLSFEEGTTFSVAPSTFTDCSFTVNNTSTNNAFLVLADASAALSLNGCSFQTTFTGLRLRSGMVLFDNNVAIDTTAGVDLASSGTTPVGYLCGASISGQVRCVSWSPDGKFVVATESTGNNLGVYRFYNNGSLSLVGSQIPTLTGPEAVSWSPDGRFFVVLGWNSNSVQVYRFNGTTSPTTVGSVVTTGSSPIRLAWSPDGRFFAVVTQTGKTLEIYRFNGISTPSLLGGAVSTVNKAYGVTWLSDGRFLAVINQGDNKLQIYQFNGISAPSLLSATASTGLLPYNIASSPDGRFLAVVNYSGNSLQIYRLTGVGTPVAVDIAATGMTNPTCVTWSPDGRFLAVGNLSADTLQIYRFNGSNTPTLVTASTIVLQNPYYLAWSPDGNFIAAADNTSPGALRIFRCNYIYSGQPSQGFSNGLLFGDSAKGSSFDATVKIMGNARVGFRGKISDDSA